MNYFRFNGKIACAVRPRGPAVALAAIAVACCPACDSLPQPCTHGVAVHNEVQGSAIEVLIEVESRTSLGPQKVSGWETLPVGEGVATLGVRFESADGVPVKVSARYPGDETVVTSEFRVHCGPSA